MDWIVLTRQEDGQPIRLMVHQIETWEPRQEGLGAHIRTSTRDLYVRESAEELDRLLTRSRQGDGLAAAGTTLAQAGGLRVAP